MKAMMAIEENERVQVTAESACRNLLVRVAKVRCQGIHNIPNSNVPEAVTWNRRGELTKSGSHEKTGQLVIG